MNDRDPVAAWLERIPFTGSLWADAWVTFASLADAMNLRHLRAPVIAPAGTSLERHRSAVRAVPPAAKPVSEPRLGALEEAA